ncbi:MAG: hypothetical protein M9954_08700 [Cyclobacteriaceae bacterium]|nr:hypothetical protein [Cyclobacteriaceae bacterium]MCB9237078.1 hypothetical protein [Flammeovirgaceae bacterium]MCB0500194.1 hypothetical protein [Cyclobacteriaceae bacterium]MCO5271725.1 hypothetical protein [Cyclobacteriaceae bacterium]MCW5901211.1 hypothetical protein [Cyclobacteriaceae bacterium]
MARKINSREYFRTLNIIYMGQLSALVLFAALAYYLIRSGKMGPENNELAITLEKVLMVVIPVSLAAGYILFRVLLRSVQPGLPLVHKMKRYSSANLIRSAFLEVPGLFASVAALVTAHVLFLTIVPLILVLFILFRPTRSVIAQELGLSVAERAKLEDPAAIISETIE